MTHVIEAEGLTKRFGATRALAGVDLAADGGQVLALLGPNGAGKTTIVRILATLLRADSGHARVSGYDVVSQAVQVRQLIGLTGQYASVDDELTGTENMLMIGRLLGFSRAQARRRAAEKIEEFGLAEAGGRAVKTYSGGMRRRLDLAASLLGRPEVLFLDEPTTGLDPRARNQVWETVRDVVAGGAPGLVGPDCLGGGGVLGARARGMRPAGGGGPGVAGPGSRGRSPSPSRPGLWPASGASGRRPPPPPSSRPGSAP